MKLWNLATRDHRKLTVLSVRAVSLLNNLCTQFMSFCTCISCIFLYIFLYFTNVHLNIHSIHLKCRWRRPTDSLLGTGISFKQNDKFTMFGLGEHVHRNSFDWSVRLATHLFGGLSHQAKSNTKETQQKIRTIQRTQTSRMYQSVLSDIDSTETYSMKLFMAPFGLQDTKTIFFRNGEFLNALTTCGSEIWVGYH